MAKFKPRYGFSEDEVQVLYLRWAMMQRSGYSVEFDSFDDFLRYARGKFEYGLTMERIDNHEGWSPANICWKSNRQKQETDIANRRQQAILWEKMMQPLRKKYAEQIANIKANEQRCFTYEHPDLVREGIVWTGT